VLETSLVVRGTMILEETSAYS